MAFQKGNSGNDKTKFKKGTSGNPKGRPKLPNLTDLMASVMGDVQQGHTAAEAILMAMRARAVKGDVKAAQFLFDRGYGKVSQPIDVDGKHVIVSVDVTEEEIKKISSQLNNEC